MICKPLIISSETFNKTVKLFWDQGRVIGKKIGPATV